MAEYATEVGELTSFARSMAEWRDETQESESASIPLHYRLSSIIH